MEVDNRPSNLPFELYRVTLQIKFCHNINIKCFERWCFYQWLFETINCLLALILSSVQSSGKDDDLCHEDSLIFSLFKYHTENNPTVFFTILNKVFHSLMEFSLYEAFFSSTYWKKRWCSGDKCMWYTLWRQRGITSDCNLVMPLTVGDFFLFAVETLCPQMVTVPSNYYQMNNLVYLIIISLLNQDYSKLSKLTVYNSNKNNSQNTVQLQATLLFNHFT